MRHPFIFARNYFGFGKLDTLVEIGVMQGDNAQEFLDYLAPRKAWLLDPWVPPASYGSGEYGSWTRENWDKIHLAVVKRFKNYPNVEIIRAFAQDVASKLPDNLGLVYIDAAHDYESIARDIDIWLPKVRPGGILSGDDYTYTGVRQAVADLQQQHPEYDIMISENETQWWFVKDPNFKYDPDMDLMREFPSETFDHRKAVE